jgi:hypothetical protein
MPSHQEFSGMVFAEFYDSAERISGDMDIDGRHKNGNLNSVVFEKFPLIDLFNYDHFPVYWRQNLVLIKNYGSFWVSEKLQYDD